MLCENIRPGNIQSESVPWSLEKHKHFFNEQLTVYSVPCLCSYSSVQGIHASLRGLKLEERDLLFLVKTFPRLGNGQTDTLAGDSFLMRWTLFLICFLKIFDEHLQFVNIS